jgi:hypothetical protein
VVFGSLFFLCIPPVTRSYHVHTCTYMHVHGATTQREDVCVIDDDAYQKLHRVTDIGVLLLHCRAAPAHVIAHIAKLKMGRTKNQMLRHELASHLLVTPTVYLAEWPYMYAYKYTN